MKALGKGSIASIIRIGLLFAWIGLWVVAGLLALAAVSYAAVLVLVSQGAIDAALLEGGGGEIALDGGGSGQFNVTYDQPGGGTWPVVVPALMIGAVAVIGALVIVWRLRRLFESFSTGEPFRRENANHLRVIWIAMLAIEVSRYLLMAASATLLMSFGRAQGVGVRDVEVSINLSTWGAILILIVLAEVFREGARLKEEQELTI